MIEFNAHQQKVALVEEEIRKIILLLRFWKSSGLIVWTTTKSIISFKWIFINFLQMTWSTIITDTPNANKGLFGHVPLLSLVVSDTFVSPPCSSSEGILVATVSVN